jgi:hypothetical protein
MIETILLLREVEERLIDKDFFSLHFSKLVSYPDDL